MTTYICHDPSLKLRRTVLEPRLQRFGLDVTWITGYPPEDYTRGILSPQEQSLIDKHSHAVRLLQESTDDYCLILEDDVDFTDEFPGILQSGLESAGILRNDWDILFIGGSIQNQNTLDWVGRRSNGILTIVGDDMPSQCRLTHAYVLSKRITHRLLERMQPPFDLAYDFLLQKILLDEHRIQAWTFPYLNQLSGRYFKSSIR